MQLVYDSIFEPFHFKPVELLVVVPHKWVLSVPKDPWFASSEREVHILCRRIESEEG